MAADSIADQALASLGGGGSAGMGYNLNTVSVSQADQNSTNTVKNGGIQFGDYKPVEASSSNYLIIAAAVVAAIFFLRR